MRAEYAGLWEGVEEEMEVDGLEAGQDRISVNVQ